MRIQSTKKMLALAGFLSIMSAACLSGTAFAVDATEAANASAPAMGAVTSSEKSRAAMQFFDGAQQGSASGDFNLDELKSNEAKPAEFDPKANPRVFEISKQLRCLVCANESIAESNVELALDLRREVAAQVKAGKTDDEIIDFMVERYGDYVLFKPPFKAKTYLLWLGPVAFFLLAFWAMTLIVRARRAGNKERRGEATEEDIARAKRILRGELVFDKGKFVENNAKSATGAEG